nr:eukaryotic translation initiation factor 3 subunit D-like isoform X3 [Aedes albopictus]
MSKNATKRGNQHHNTTRKWSTRPPSKVSDAPNAVCSDRITVEENKDFSRLSKPSLPNVGIGKDITDRVQNKRPLQRVDRIFHTVTTNDGPVIRPVPKSHGNVYTTGAILATSMCGARSNYSWDIFIEKIGNHLSMTKHDNTELTVNETSILRYMLDSCMKQKDGKYIIKKDPNKPMIRLYDILDNSSESNGEAKEVYDDAAFHANGPPAATSEAVTVAANAAAAAAATGATISTAMERGTAVAATIPSIDLQRAGCGGGPLRTLSKNSTKERDQRRGTILERGVRPPPKIRDALAAANPDRVTVEEGDFPCLSKLSLLSTAPVATGKTSAATKSATSAAASKFRPPSILKERSAEEIRQYMESQAKKWLKGGRVATAANSSGSSQQDRCGGSVYRLSHGEGDIQEYYVASIVEVSKNHYFQDIAVTGPITFEFFEIE